MRASNKERRLMLALMEKWQNSGMRQIEFYRQHNLLPHVFYYWRTYEVPIEDSLPPAWVLDISNRYFWL